MPWLQSSEIEELRKEQKRFEMESKKSAVMSYARGRTVASSKQFALLGMQENEEFAEYMPDTKVENRSIDNKVKLTGQNCGFVGYEPDSNKSGLPMQSRKTVASSTHTRRGVQNEYWKPLFLLVATLKLPLLWAM